MTRPIIILLVLAMLAACSGGSEKGSKSVARLDDGRLIVKIDLKWDSATLNKYADLYGIDSSTVGYIISGKRPGNSDSTQWVFGQTIDNTLEISKNTLTEQLESVGFGDILMMDDQWVRKPADNSLQQVKWGVNIFEEGRLFSEEDSIVTFRLTSKKNIAEVFVAGSFNGWSTMSTPLIKVSNYDWEAKVKIKPGKIWYKFIIDGKWSTDPDNRIKERLENQGIVSAAFVPNHIFILRGHENARNVVVTGSFNNWNRNGVKMIKKGNNWILPIFLNTGTYGYKFIADGNWMPDPENTDNRTDASGNMNSFISTGKQTIFRLNGYQDAEKVILAGSFNRWSTNELVMKKDSAGWMLGYALEPGLYEYKFIADGMWMTDPENPVTTGSGRYINSIKVVEPNHIFTLDGFGDAENVIVTGSFNNWNRDNYRMKREGKRWVFEMRLPEGKNLYKFIVDGNWTTDPQNNNIEDNQYGTGNSVLWIEN